MNRRRFLAAGAGTLAALAGCFGGPDRSLPEPPTGEWRQSAHDARNTGAAGVAVPPRGTPAWDNGEAHIAAPLVADGTVFSVANEATALDARTGDQQWRTDLPGKADHTPALDSDRLIATTDQQVVALAREDGAELWSTSLPRPADGAVTVVADPPLVTVPVADTGLLAYDSRTGDRLWRDSTISASAAAVADGTAYFTGYKQDGDTGVLRGVAATDGSRLWETDLDHPDAPPVVANDGVLVADGGTLAVHDPADGTRRRPLGTFGDRIEEIPTIDDGTAFIASGEGALVAVSVADGSTEWRVDSRVTAGTGISVGREAVVAAVTDLPESSLAGIAAFERSDGTTRWEHQIEGFDAYASTVPVLAAGAVFYTSNESAGVVALGDLPSQDEE